MSPNDGVAQIEEGPGWSPVSLVGGEEGVGGVEHEEGEAGGSD